MASRNKPNRPVTDWEAIEREYRAGQLSVHEIARQNGISHTAINKKAKILGWKRNLSDRVRKAVKDRLIADSVSEEVSKKRDNDAVETAASRGVEIVRQHRQDISTFSNLVRMLGNELSTSTITNENIVEDIEEATKGDKNNIRRLNMLRSVALPTRAGVIKDLANAAKVLIELERKAFSLDAPDENESKTLTIRIVNDPDGDGDN